jgi:TusA-related sulfurtransferase
MIYTPFGCECTIVAREKTGTMAYGEVLTVSTHDNEACRQFRAWELKADGGIKEIAQIAEALPSEAVEPGFGFDEAKQDKNPW